MKVVAITKDKISKPSIKGLTVHNYLWQEFGNKDLNLRDYDGVIIDLTGIDAKVPGIDWVAFTSALSFDVTKDILVEGSNFVIVVGNPFLNTGDKTVAELLGVKLECIDGKGNSINKTEYLKKSKYRDYLQNIKTYEYSFEKPAVIHKIKALADTIDFKHDVDEIPYLITRAGKIIAAQLEPVIYSTNYQGYRSTVHSIYNGELIFLPSSKLDPSEAIRILLEAHKGNEGDSSKPEWLKLIQVAGEKEINNKILDKQTIIEEVIAQKGVLLLELDDLRKPLGVLYKSDKPLEESIKDLFKSIGATIIEPETSDKVEFYIIFEELRFVVEAKSTISANIDQKGLRQVLDWQNDAYDLTGEDYKPLVVASVHYDKPLDVRNTEILPSNLVEYSTKKDIAVITVMDLYKISQDITKGDIEIDFFMDQLNSLSGLYVYRSPESETQSEKT